MTTTDCHSNTATIHEGKCSAHSRRDSEGRSGTIWCARTLQVIHFAALVGYFFLSYLLSFLYYCESDKHHWVFEGKTNGANWSDFRRTLVLQRGTINQRWCQALQALWLVHLTVSLFAHPPTSAVISSRPMTWEIRAAQLSLGSWMWMNRPQHCREVQ